MKMNKDLTWTLKQQPTAGELAELVRLHVLSAEEARNIAFNKGKATNASKVTTVVHFLLDGSGSMQSCRQSTIDGYNEYINSLKNDGGKYKFSLTSFDSGFDGKLQLNRIHKNVYIDDVPELTLESYVPGGGTPLNDAFCTTLKEVHSRPNEKHLFVVLTDGEENMSKKYTAKQMKDLKAEYEEKGNWTFVYLGANQDAFATGATYGFSPSNISNFNATAAGTGMVFSTLSVATRSLSSTPTMNSSAFYTKEEQLDNEQTK